MKQVFCVLLCSEAFPSFVSVVFPDGVFSSCVHTVLAGDLHEKSLVFPFTVPWFWLSFVSH